LHQLDVLWTYHRRAAQKTPTRANSHQLDVWWTSTYRASLTEIWKSKNKKNKSAEQKS